MSPKRHQEQTAPNQRNDVRFEADPAVPWALGKDFSWQSSSKRKILRVLPQRLRLLGEVQEAIERTMNGPKNGANRDFSFHFRYRVRNLRLK